MKKQFVLLAAVLLLATGCSGRSGRSSNPSSQSALSASSSASSVSSSALLAEADSKEATQADTADATGSASATDNGPSVEVLTLTVPEGYTLSRIGMTLEDMGVCTADEFIAATQEGDYSGFPLIAAQEQNPNRCFKLEGYLFPDTYQIYSTDPPESIIRRMLTNTEKRIGPELREAIAKSGYTVDETLALASIIEKEAFGHEYMGYISSVLHNRLDLAMKLQCDVAIKYVEGAIKPFITGDIDRYNAYYNTYKCDGIPAGAICNPGMDAIRAALNPPETDYLFFVTDKDQNYYFTAEWEEHQANVERLGINAAGSVGTE